MWKDFFIKIYCIFLLVIVLSTGVICVHNAVAIKSEEVAAVQINESTNLAPAWRIEKIKWEFEEPPGLVIYRLVDDNGIYEDYIIVESHHESTIVTKLERKR